MIAPVKFLSFSIAVSSTISGKDIRENDVK